jgi:hypothetical protein
MEMENKRPIGVTILAALAVVIGLLTAVAALQWLGLFPWLGNGPEIRTFNLWYAMMYGLLAYIYFWLAQMLLTVNQSAWIFLAVITMFNLIFGVMTVITSNMPTADATSAMIVLNAVVLIYIMLPGTRRAFGQP